MSSFVGIFMGLFLFVAPSIAKSGFYTVCGVCVVVVVVVVGGG